MASIRPGSPFFVSPAVSTRFKAVSESLNLKQTSFFGQKRSFPPFLRLKVHSTIEERVYKIVSEQLGVKVSEITPSASFINDLGADSLDTVELVMALEEEFDTEMADEAAEKITTVQQAVDYINGSQS